MSLPADDLAGMLERALEGDTLDPPPPAAFARDGAPYSVEELLCGLEPLADHEARPLVPAPEPPPVPEPSPAPLPSLDIDDDDVLILAESEEEDSQDETDDSTLAALSVIADALRALAVEEPPPEPEPVPEPEPDATDEILVLTDDFLAPPEEGEGDENATTLTLQNIVAALHALTEPPPPAPTVAEPAEDEALVLTDDYLAPEPPPAPEEDEDEDGDVLVLSDEIPAPEPAPEPEPEPEPLPPPAAESGETATLTTAESDETAALTAAIGAIIAAHLPPGVPPADKGDATLPERLDVLAQLLADPPPSQDFAALDALYLCWSRHTQDSPSRALLAVAQNLSRNFGLPGKLPMASAKAWRMLSPSVFEAELAQRLADVGTFIADWQKTQRSFLILEFSEIELIEYLFEALHPGYHADILAGVMNYKVLSNRRLGLLRRIPARARKQVAPLLPDQKDKALVELVHAKALLERVAGETGFAPIVETATKAAEEMDKMMKAVANIGAPPPPPGPGGGLALGRIG